MTIETDKPHLVPVARKEIFAGGKRHSAGEREVVILRDGVAGSIVCFECGGTDDWPRRPELEIRPLCASCGPILPAKTLRLNLCRSHEQRGQIGETRPR